MQNRGNNQLMYIIWFELYRHFILVLFVKNCIKMCTICSLQSLWQYSPMHDLHGCPVNCLHDKQQHVLLSTSDSKCLVKNHLNSVETSITTTMKSGSHIIMCKCI